MVIVEPVKPPRTSDPKEIEKFFREIAQRASYISDASDPITGAVLPRWIGDRYLETDTNDWWISTGTTVASWVSVSGAAYGEMYMTNASQVVTVGATNTAYEVPGSFTAGELNLVTFGGSHFLQVATAGRYRIVWSMSVDTGFAQNELEGGIMLNSAVLSPDKGTSHTTVAILSLGSTISGSAIADLAAGNQISLYLRNHSATNNITVEHASVTLVRVGGT